MLVNVVFPLQVLCCQKREAPVVEGRYVSSFVCLSEWLLLLMIELNVYFFCLCISRIVLPVASVSPKVYRRSI